MSFWIGTEDWHTGYLPTAPTVRDRRLNVINTPNHPLDQLRQSLCHEPRGHSDQYGGFITLPDNNDAHFGVLFWHKDGFSTACGHGTIALGYWAVTKKLVQVPENGNVDVVIDVPSGRVVAKVAVERGRPVHGDFINVKSYQIAKGLSVTVPSRNFDVKVNLAFAGAVYAHVDVTQLGLTVEPSRHIDFINIGREIKVALGTKAHYGDYDLYGVIFYNEEGPGDSGEIRQRNITIFADGQIDRSPCGSGTASRIAVLLAEGRLGAGKGKLLHRSIIDTLFEADIVSEEISPVEFPACIPRVRGTANLVGRMSFFIDPADPVYPGFLLR
ncbi:proline racemase [Fusarium sporotrichioides]|uniref:trans-L-3-hydroxyproline dehydratase n=1 Tax=Fusarium sporotrichioides TaxID=5514 RepID=A0A395SNX2_FUSSP|nr:proline racemase [Fusarium sporotrichioides]